MLLSVKIHDLDGISVLTSNTGSIINSRKAVPINTVTDTHKNQYTSNERKFRDETPNNLYGSDQQKNKDEIFKTGVKRTFDPLSYKNPNFRSIAKRITNGKKDILNLVEIYGNNFSGDRVN